MKDWKSGHRRMCRKLANKPSEEMAQKAMVELQALLAENHDLGSLTADMNKAQDEVERLKKNQPGEGKSNKDTRDGKTGDKHAKAPTATKPKTKREPLSLDNQSQSKSESLDTSINSHWDFWIENLCNISSYQITLKPKLFQQQNVGSITQFAEQLAISISPNEKTPPSSRVVVRHGPETQIFCQTLQGKINPEPSSFQVYNEAGGSLHLRLQYESSSLDQPMELQPYCAVDEDNANQLCCRYCHLRLIQPRAKLDRVVQMPSANWDDIGDYLICYSGVSCLALRWQWVRQVD